jgi:hypothetical protein
LPDATSGAYYEITLDGETNVYFYAEGTNVLINGYNTAQTRSFTPGDLLQVYGTPQRVSIFVNQVLWTTVPASGVATVLNVFQYQGNQILTFSNVLLVPSAVGATGPTGNTGNILGNVYSGPDNASATWMFLGTWTTVQNGECLYMRLIAHVGYNAVATENQVTELMFAASNGSAFISGTGGGNFYANGLATVNSRLGTGGSTPSYKAPQYFRIVQASVTSYQIYVYYAAAYMRNANYSVQIGPATSWTNSSSLASAPSGTYLDITPTAL